MPAFFEYAEADGVLRMTLAGELKDDNLREVRSRASVVSASFPGCKAIVDLSNVSSYGVSSTEIAMLAQSPPAQPSIASWVIVAPTDAIYGMSRMFQMLADRTRPNLHIVHTMDEAYALLGVKSPQFVPISPE